MYQQYGFTLVEVLLSLVLTTTVALLLLEFQSKTSLFINQVIQQNQASSILDHADEDLLFGAKHRFKPVNPYTLHIEQNGEHTKLNVFWLAPENSLSRTYLEPKFFSE